MSKPQQPPGTLGSETRREAPHWTSNIGWTVAPALSGLQIVARRIAALAKSRDAGDRELAAILDRAQRGALGPKDMLTVLEHLPWPTGNAGRPTAQQTGGGFKVSDPQLLLAFEASHGRFPKGYAEWCDLARKAGGKDSMDDDPVSAITRLRAAAREMRAQKI